MSIGDRIQEDVKTAMKAREKSRVGTLRMLQAAIKNAEIEAGEPLTEEGEQAILKRQLKQREESEEAYRRAGREEQAESEASEAGVIREYLPEPLSGEEVEGVVDRAISETGAEGMRDMGRVMGRAQELADGRADGKQLASLVKEKLQ